MSARRFLCLSSVGLALVAAQVVSAAAQRDPLATVTADRLHALVDEHQGDVVVVNFWATWCPPCKAEFPDIIRVYDDYRTQGLAVIAVSMNADDETEDVSAFLEAFAPSFPVYRAATQDEVFYEGIVEMIDTVEHAAWFGELPITLVFDRAGNPVHYHRKPVTYDGLVEDVTALLSASTR